MKKSINNTSLAYIPLIGASVFLGLSAYLGLTQSACAQEQAGDVLLTYESQSCGNYTKAEFRFWSPSYNGPIQGVIVLVPGSNIDGLDMLNAPGWRALALKYHLAIVSCYLQGDNYFEAKDGTGEALLGALGNFAERSNHSEIESSQLLLYGESAGGQFNYSFTLWKPNRVMAFIVNKGGFYDVAAPTCDICSIPGLFIYGQLDSYCRMQAVTQIWNDGRKRGALWALAPEPGTGHDFSKTPSVAQSFFEGTLQKRLIATQANSTIGLKTNPLQENQGWIGNLTTYAIDDASHNHLPVSGCSWFPNEESAKAWKAFVTPED